MTCWLRRRRAPYHYGLGAAVIDMRSIGDRGGGCGLVDRNALRVVTAVVVCIAAIGRCDAVKTVAYRGWCIRDLSRTLMRRRR